MTLKFSVVVVAPEIPPPSTRSAKFDGLALGANCHWYPRLVVPLALTVKLVEPPSHALAPTGCVLIVIVAVDAVTVKSLALVAVFAPIVTVIFPVVAPTGTTVLIVVAVLDDTVADTPLNLTSLTDGVALKFVPLIVTVAPWGPLAGVNPVIVGAGEAVTVKFVALVAVAEEPTTTVILPVVAPTGTLVVIFVVVLVVTTAVVPLNFTTLFAGVVLKFVPFTVTVAPTGPEVGVKLVIVGFPVMVKSATLVNVVQ